MSFVRGLAYALRSLSRSPALTVALLATIAVGTGTHAALTGFVNGLLTRTLAIPDAGATTSTSCHPPPRSSPSARFARRAQTS